MALTSFQGSSRGGERAEGGVFVMRCNAGDAGEEDEVGDILVPVVGVVRS